MLQTPRKLILWVPTSLNRCDHGRYVLRFPSSLHPTSWLLKYLTPQADKYLKHIEEHLEGGAPTIKACHKIDVQSKAECGTSDVSSPKDAASLITTESGDIPDVPFRPCEKRRLHWSGLTCQYCSVPNVYPSHAPRLQIWHL